ncbi:translocation/assembly module TamB domain-containing protein [Algoriphagus halophytocola]|uniref:Translocation/assembly module TamB domain-containing protein n=1 Tax=Algoriphagus halophytocola TaxID=2991499 RepID=A0ABY6MEY3_9BACT|nr:translocation/assembly module TamB domain-containing protein [Algoriphagus sp. TR-M5]UZD22373.1 translocation/assembly module TamB domain-containing protein [Algoriphagus sp. TR-M5]
MEKNAKVTDFLHKAFRILLWVVFSLLMLLIVLALALQVTWVQNKTIDTITGILNKDSKFHTEIGNIRLTWWDALELNEVQILDHRDSLMIGARKLTADFDLLSVLPPGDPTLNAVRVEEAQLHLAVHEGDSVMNINLWVEELTDLFSTGSSNRKGANFYINEVALRNSEVNIINENTEPITDGVDYAKLRFGNITLNANNFSVEQGEIGAEIKLLTGVEQSSGLEIQELVTDLTFSPEYLEFDRLSLKTKKSHIKDFLRFEYASVGSFSDFVDKVVLIANMDESKIDLGDLKLFAPNLPDIDDQIYLSGKVTGPVSDFKSDEFLVRLGEKTALFGAFQLDGLPDVNDTYINLSLKNSTILASDLGPYLKQEQEVQIQKFNTIRLTADFAGYLHRFDTNGEFKTAIGDLIGRLRFEKVNELPIIVSNITLKNLDLGVLTGNRELFQKVSLQGRVNTEGNTLENILVDVDANVSKFGFNHYNYSNIDTDATYGLDLFRGNLSIADPNLKMDARGSVNLRASTDSVRLNLQIDTAFLDSLHFAERASFISGKIDVDTKGIDLDEVQGIARFRDVSVGFEDRFLEVGDFYFQSLFAGGTRTMSVNSDYLVAAASGQFDLKQMGSDLEILLQQYISIIINEEQPIADLERNFSETYNLDLNLRLIDINPIVQLLEPDLSFSKNTVLEGAFYQTKENTVFNFFTSIDTLIYQGNTARDINIDFNTSKLINSPDILASFYIYSKNQQLGKSLEFTNLGFEAIWDQNEVDMNFTLDQDSTQSAARVDAFARFSASNTELVFEPSSLKVLNREWQFDPLNQITITPGEIAVDSLKLFSEGQSISLQGKISESPEEKLMLAIKHVNLDLLNTLLPQDFDGTTDGQIVFQNLFNSPKIQGNVNLDQVAINDFPIGDMQGDVDLNTDRLQLSLVNRNEERESIRVEGYITVPEQEIFIDAHLNEASLVIAEPFLSNYISNLGGTIKGDMAIRGTTSNPEIDGIGTLNQGKLTVNYLKTTYLLNGNILFKPQQISFQEVDLRDLYNNRATLTGGINHNGFNNIRFDMKADMENLQVMNTSERDNETFFGTAFVTGNAEVVGTTTNLDINARATSQPNTRIFIPLTDNSSQTQEDFIHMINVQDTVRIQEIADEINRLEIENVRMNFVLDITPDAYAEIIIDPRTEEKISGRGRGVLTMNVDTQGNFTLNGTYEITEGLYNFSLYNVLKKEFRIKPGGRITWYGDPYEGIMNISAEYQESVSLQPLLASTVTTNTDQNTGSSRRYPVKVLLNLEGELLSPDITFGFDFTEFPSSGEAQTTISSFQNRIANDEQEMNRQVFSVIMTRSFSPEGQFSGVSNFSSSLGQLLSSQLNSFLGQVDKNLEIDLDVASLDQNTLETFQLSVAYTFLDGRLRVSRDGGFTDNTGNASASSIIGDWQAEYMLTEEGVYRIRIFNRNNFNTFTSLSLSENVSTYGVALSQNVSFNSFSELFNKITRKKNEKLIINDSDDYLRYQHSEEDWKEINLDNIENRLDSLNQNRPIEIPQNRRD